MTLIILGEFNPTAETHKFTDNAISHSLDYLNKSLQSEWVSTEDISDEILGKASAIWIATGAPYKNLNKALSAIKYARLNNIPCLGTCQGFQHIMLEYAQSFLGLDHPGHEEYGNYEGSPWISALSCSLRGQSHEIEILKDSTAHGAYKSPKATESFYCSYGINPDYYHRINSDFIKISGVDQHNQIRIVEYPSHRFMVATLFVPQARSKPDKPHPLVNSFINSI